MAKIPEAQKCTGVYKRGTLPKKQQFFSQLKMPLLELGTLGIGFLQRVKRIINNNLLP